MGVPNASGTLHENRSALLHRDLHTTPYQVCSASGLYFTLSDGREVFDASGGAAVSCVGHGRDVVNKTAERQLSELDYCHSMFFSHPMAETLCRYLVDSTGNAMAKALLVGSGSEAMEAAMKLSRQYFLEMKPPQPYRTRFIARKQSYHGATLGSLAMSGHKARRGGFEPLLSDQISHVSPCYEYREKRPKESNANYVARLVVELDEMFQKVGPETVCAFVAETVVGAALGCVPAVEQYFPAMKAVCDKYGALLVMDEVMCGMGRTGTLHAWEQEGIVPDIQTVGKALGGGYAPIAGLLVGHRVTNTLQNGSGRFSHGQTYQAHPLSCALALNVQQVIQHEQLLDNVKAMGVYLGSKLKEALGKHDNVGDIRGRGLFWGIEFVRDKLSKEAFGPELGVARRIHEYGMEMKSAILLYPGAGTIDGEMGDHILVAPAYNIGKKEVNELVDRLKIAVVSVLDSL